MWYFAIVLPCQIVTDCQLALLQAILWVGLLPCYAPYAFCKACRKARLPYTVSALAPLLLAMLPSPPWWLSMAGNATSSISFCQVQLLSLLHPYTTYCTLTQRTAPLQNVHICMLTSLSGCMSVVCSLSLLSSLCPATNSMLMGSSMSWMCHSFHTKMPVS